MISHLLALALALALALGAARGPSLAGGLLLSGLLFDLAKVELER